MNDFQMYEEGRKEAQAKQCDIHSVVNSVACEHEEQTMQGDGFTYVICAKCGIDL